MTILFLFLVAVMDLMVPVGRDLGNGNPDVVLLVVVVVVVVVGSSSRKEMSVLVSVVEAVGVGRGREILGIILCFVLCPVKG